MHECWDAEQAAEGDADKAAGEQPQWPHAAGCLGSSILQRHIEHWMACTQLSLKEGLVVHSVIRLRHRCHGAAGLQAP